MTELYARASKPGVMYHFAPSATGTLAKTEYPDGTVDFAQATPPPSGPPPLPVGEQTLGGETFKAKNVIWPGGGAGSSFRSPPAGAYAYYKPVGPGTNQGWDGTGTSVDPVTGELILTTTMKNGRVNNGGEGYAGALELTAPYIVDWSMFFDPTYCANLVRYGLTMQTPWPEKQENDNLEGVPGNMNIHLHTAQGTLNGIPWYEPLGVWIAFRLFVIPGMGIGLLSGADWTSLAQKGAITQAQISAIGASIDLSPHAFDVAQEAEGPISSLPNPVVDKVGTVVLYERAA